MLACTARNSKLAIQSSYSEDCPQQRRPLLPLWVALVSPKRAQKSLSHSLSHSSWLLNRDRPIRVSRPEVVGVCLVCVLVYGPACSLSTAADCVRSMESLPMWSFPGESLPLESLPLSTGPNWPPLLARSPQVARPQTTRMSQPNDKEQLKHNSLGRRTEKEFEFSTQPMTSGGDQSATNF